MIEPLRADAAFLADLDEFKRQAGHVTFWWLGQSGYLLHHRNTWFMIDPYLSDSLTEKYAKTDKPHLRASRRVVDPRQLADKLRSAFAVTSSHGHSDHLDPDTLRPLVDCGMLESLYMPSAISALAAERTGIRKRSDRHERTPEVTLYPMDDGTTNQIGPGIRVSAIAAAHDQIDRDENGKCKYLGYVFEFSPYGNSAQRPFVGPKELTVYHSGDTVAYDGLAQRLRPFNIDIAILPINGKIGNMGGRDAARLAKDLGARLVIPCHYDMFEFNTADPNDEFVPECERIGQPYRVLQLGERFSSSELFQR